MPYSLLKKSIPGVRATGHSPLRKTKTTSEEGVREEGRGRVIGVEGQITWNLWATGKMFAFSYRWGQLQRKLIREKEKMWVRFKMHHQRCHFENRLSRTRIEGGRAGRVQLY